MQEITRQVALKLVLTIKRHLERLSRNT